MYGSHVMSHNLSEQLLLKPMLPKDITQSQEGWEIKKNSTDGLTSKGSEPSTEVMFDQSTT